jgi:hypothetical protein
MEDMEIERRLTELGLRLPEPMRMPPDVEIPFAWVRIRDNRLFVSGHGPLQPDGTPAGPFGKVPTDVPLEQAQEWTRLATLAVLSSLKASLATWIGSRHG